MRNCWSRSDRNASHASTRLGTNTAVTNTSATFFMPIHVVAPQMSFGERKLPVGGFPDRLQKVPRGLAEFAARHFSDEPANGRFSESAQPSGARARNCLFLCLRTVLAILRDLLHELPFHRRRDQLRTTNYHSNNCRWHGRNR